MHTAPTVVCECMLQSILTNCFQAFHFPRCAQIVTSQQEECNNDKRHYNENVIVGHSWHNHYGQKLQHDLRGRHNTNSYSGHDPSTEPHHIDHNDSIDKLQFCRCILVWSSDTVWVKAEQLVRDADYGDSLLLGSHRKYLVGCHQEIQCPWKTDWEFVLIKRWTMYTRQCTQGNGSTSNCVLFPTSIKHTDIHTYSVKPSIK